MAYGVQLGTKYTLIGGPREPNNYFRRNYIPNPSAVNGSLFGIVSASYYTNLATLAAVREATAGGFDGPWTVSVNVTVTAGQNFKGVEFYSFGPPDSLPIDEIPPAGWYYVGYVSIYRTAAKALRFITGQPGGPATNTAISGATGVGQYVTYFSPPIQLDVNSSASGHLHIAVAKDNVSETDQFYVREAGLIPVPGPASASWTPIVNGDHPGYRWRGIRGQSVSEQDGTRAVLNDSTDPDFIGYAAEVTGLEGADVRENFTDNIEADGAVHGEFYQSRRPVTITAAIGGNTTPATRNARQQRWTAASRALRNRGTAHRPAALRWQPDGAVEEMFTILRRQQRPTITGLQLKEASVAMIAADPRIYGVRVYSYQHTPSGSGTAGRSYDRSYNVNYNWAPLRGTFSVSNIGDADAPVIIELENGMDTFAIQNLTTEEEISINGSITNGQSITIDTAARTIWLQDGTNLFDRIELSRTRWWGLAPGSNSLAFLANTFDASARVRIFHRPAWA